MLNGKYISIETIIAGAYRDLGLSEQINFEDAVEWVGEVMELIQAPFQYIDKIEYLEVKSNKAKLPCDLLYITSVNGATEYNEKCPGDSKFFPMRYSTNTFHHRYCENMSCDKGDLTYQINDDFIFPSFEEGTIAISYKAMPTDKRGFPLVPENIKFKRAATDYIKWKLGFIEWSRGNMIQAVYVALEREYLFSVGAAQNEGNMPTLDMMESIKNSWLRLIPKINEHSSNFSSTGSQEQRYIHNASGKNFRTGRNPINDKGNYIG